MGEVLTAAKILARTKLSSLSEVRNLNLWGNDLSDISVVRELPNLEVLSLSVNRVSSLAPLSGCTKLRELYLRKNDLSDLKQILYLTSLPALRILWLSDNPLAALPQYRDYVLAKLPGLTKLDNTDVTEEEREVARKKEREGVLSPSRGGSSKRTGNFDFGSPRPTGIGSSSMRSPRAATLDSEQGVYSPRRALAASPVERSLSPARYSAQKAYGSSSMRGGQQGEQQLSPRASPSYYTTPSRRSAVPPLQLQSSNTGSYPSGLASPTQRQAQLAADLAAEAAARRRTEALEEEVEQLRLAEEEARDRERREEAASYSTHSQSARSYAPPLSPHSAAHAAAYVGGPPVAPYGSVTSRPASARPAAGERQPYTPSTARGTASPATYTPNKQPPRPYSAAVSSFASPRPSPGGVGRSPSLSPRASPAPAPLPSTSSLSTLTPRSSGGLSAPKATQHNLLCACLPMLEELDVEHLQWLRAEIDQKIAAKQQRAHKQ